MSLLYWLPLVLADEGRSIYESGQGADPVQVTLNDGLTLSARLVPCIGCHGPRGAGEPEGGLVPSDIRWAMLSRPYLVTTPSGRRHGPYDRNSFLKAITEGIDPSGNALHPGMPRYQLSPRDAAALALFVEQTLGHDPVAGVRDDQVRVGAFLPATDWGAALIEDWQRTIDILNRNGGIYGRTLQLDVRAAPEAPSERAAALDSLLKDEPVFALLAPYVDGAEPELIPLLAAAKIPVIGPLGSTPSLSPAPSFFYLSNGVPEEIRALVEQIAQDGGPAALVRVPGDDLNPLEVIARQHAQKLGIYLADTPFLDDPHRMVRGISKFRNLLLLGTDAQAVALRNLAGPYTTVLTLGSLAPSLSARVDWSGRVVVSSHLPFSEEHASLRLGRAALEVLLSALQTAGRDLHQAALIDALETPDGVQSELFPSISFDSSRRVGATGVFLRSFTLDKGWTEAWVEPIEQAVRSTEPH